MQRRYLTEGEQGLCRSVFKDAIDYTQVQIFNHKWWLFQPAKVTMAPDGNLWFHPKGGLFCDDYCGQSLSLQGLFIHEMTHVWQHQCGVFLPLARHPFCSYDYELVPGKPYAKYGIEQQAEIVRHVFLLGKGAHLKSGLTMADYKDVLPF